MFVARPSPIGPVGIWQFHRWQSSSVSELVQIAQLCAGRRVFAPLNGDLIGTSDGRETPVADPFGFTRAREMDDAARSVCLARELLLAVSAGDVESDAVSPPPTARTTRRWSARDGRRRARDPSSRPSSSDPPRGTTARSSWRQRRRRTSPRAPPRRRHSRPSRPAPAFPSPTSRSSTRRYPTSASSRRCSRSGSRWRRARSRWWFERLTRWRTPRGSTSRRSTRATSRPSRPRSSTRWSRSASS